MFMTLMNGLAWLFVIAIGIIVALAVGYGLWRALREVLEAIGDLLRFVFLTIPRVIGRSLTRHR